ncbi:uncharacterized protein LOC141901108 [Tubulanus polymorphus]|uniref:uncharacterized protein LOC141901108 n=1 Tax=Tubulanus polymorphus TaxID=672921 RepID=UPI003DA41412
MEFRDEMNSCVSDIYTEELAGSALLEKLKIQRDNQRFCNVVFHVQHPNDPSKSVLFYAHKNVLAALSPYFDSILKSNRTDKEHVSVYSSNHEVVKDLIDYFYTGIISISVNNVEELLMLSNCFLLEKVKNYCAEFLERNISVVNCLSMKEIADKCALFNLSLIVSQFIQTNLYIILQQNEILEYNQAKLESFITNRNLNMPASLKLQLLVKWTAYKLEERESAFNLFLNLLRPNEIELQIVSKIIEHEPLFQRSEACLFYILDLFRRAGAQLIAFTDIYQTLSEKLAEHESAKAAADILDMAMNSTINDNGAVVQSTPTQLVNTKSESNVTDGHFQQVRLKAPSTTSTGSKICIPDEMVRMQENTEQLESIEDQNVENNDEEDLTREQTDVADTDIERDVSVTDENPRLGVDENNDEPSDEITEKKRPADEDNGDDESNYEDDDDDDDDVTVGKDPDYCPSENEENGSDHVIINVPKYSPLSKNRRKRIQPRRISTPARPSKKQRTNELKISKRIALSPEKTKKDVTLVSKSAGSKKKKKLKLDSQCEQAPDVIENAAGNHQELFTCEICRFKSVDEEGLQRHTEINHSITLKCNVCSFTSQWSRSYYRHMKTHFEGPPFKCDFDFCEYTTERIQQILYHRMRHTDERPFPCNLCGMRFRTKNNAMTHMRCHTGEKPFQCVECKKSFATKSTLDQHQATHSNNRPFLCDICGFSTKYQSHLISHKRLHSGDVFTCQFAGCKYFTPKRSQLNAHMRIHSAIRSYICSHCGRSFVEKSHLVRHERIHLDDKPFKCEMCDYGSSRRDKLKEHIIKHHGDNPTVKSPYKKRKSRKQSPTNSLPFSAVIEGGHTYLNLQPSTTALNSSIAVHDYEGIVKGIDFSDKSLVSLDAAVALPVHDQRATAMCLPHTPHESDLITDSHRPILIDPSVSNANTAFQRLQTMAAMQHQQQSNASQYPPQTDIGGLSAFMALF